MSKEATVIEEIEKTSQSNESNYKNIVMNILKKYGMLLILLALIILMSFLSPAFLTSDNLLNIVRQMSVVGIAAIGVTFVIITGGIDLSSGSVIALTSVVAASMAQPDSYFVFVPIIVGIGIGLAAGAINGTIIAKGYIAPFIVTLGMMTIARGLALLYTGGRPIGGLSDSFAFIGRGAILGIPVPILIFAAVAVFSYILLNKTTFGKYVYAMGGNEQAAIIAGVNVSKYKIIVYGYAGMLAGLAGVILTSRVASGQPTAGLMYELDAIAAAVIGGTSLAGGIGTIGGTVIGVLILGVINNSFDLLNISSYWQQIIKGIIIIVAVFVDSKKNKRK